MALGTVFSRLWIRFVNSLTIKYYHAFAHPSTEKIALFAI